MIHRFLAGIAILAGLAGGFGLPASPAGATLAGSVFADDDGDGVRDSGESLLPGIRVSDGLHVSTTDDQGRYSLPGSDEARVFVTRPDGFDCDVWYRVGGGDFALTRTASTDAFFFIQISDAHVYERASDFQRYSFPAIPGWMPDWLSAQVMLWFLQQFYFEHDREDIVEGFRRALQPHFDIGDSWSSRVLLSYVEEFQRPGSELGRPAADFRAAIDEIAGLAPAFVISTGDMVLDGTNAPAEPVRGWLSFYDQVTRASGIDFYETIGNNEITGIGGDLSPGDPGYARGVFEDAHGPPHYSFDRGPFHFVALDTHRAVRGDEGQLEWVFDRMEPGVAEWLERDLSLHRDQVLVVLNHEPFHTTPEWSRYEPADAEGLFAKHAVAYSLAGHLHRNGFSESGATTHITTGALSGMRWLIPTEIHARGYRLFYAKERRLYSAWKDLGEPVLGFILPSGDLELHAGAKSGAESGEIVVVAADVEGPFESVELLYDGKPLSSERWGDFFLRASISPELLSSGATFELRGYGSGGQVVTKRIQLPTAADRPRP